MIITQTPVRLSLFGGNTDFREYYLNYGGLVVSATIDKYIYCIVKKRFDNLIIVNYSKKEIVERIDDIEHALVREALRLLKIRKGIEISFLADIPSKGTGLGSSSSVLVGLLNALHTYLGENVSSHQLAEEAVKIEVDILNKPIGVQDQYAAAIGGMNELVFMKTGKVEADRVSMKRSIQEDFNNSLMLLYTGINRSTDDVLSSFNPLDHVVDLGNKKLMATECIRSLKDGDLSNVGRLLNDSWESKKKSNSKTTTPEIDIMYHKAMVAGALGGKIIGAGGGGFLLIMFPANKRAQIRRSLRQYKEMPFRFSHFGSRVIFQI